MRKQQIIVLGVVLGVALLGLIYIQARYFQTAFKLKKAQFDYSVNRSLTGVIAYIEDKDKQDELRREEAEKQQSEEKGVDVKGKYKKVKMGMGGRLFRTKF